MFDDLDDDDVTDLLPDTDSEKKEQERQQEQERRSRRMTISEVCQLFHRWNARRKIESHHLEGYYTNLWFVCYEVLDLRRGFD